MTNYVPKGLKLEICMNKSTEKHLSCHTLTSLSFPHPGLISGWVRWAQGQFGGSGHCMCKDGSGQIFCPSESKHNQFMKT